MPRLIGNKIDGDYVYIDYTLTQNIALNQTTIAWTIGWAFRTPSPTDRDLDNGSLRIAGSLRWSNANPYNFSSTFGDRDLDLASGSYTVTHNANGHLSVTFAASITPFGEPASTISTTIALPRIPKPPSAPGTPTAGTPGATSVPLSWTAPTDDGGASISSYTVEYATDAAFTAGLGSQSFASTSGTVTGLAPGQTYHFRVRAVNAQGAGAWSSSTSAAVLLPAPTFTSWVQNSAGELVGSWTPPTPATGLIGYRLQLARDAGFTTGVQNIDLGNVTSHAVAGLAGGRTWHARVAARTAGGTNTYSASRSQLLVLAAGDLDGWTSLGSPPASIARYTTEGIRRGTIDGRQALLVESLATAAGTLTADAIGIQRTVTGLTIGSAYRFTASAQLTDAAALANDYRLAVVGEGVGSSVEISASRVSLGTFEFVADSTTVTLQIRLSQTVTVAGANDVVERVAFTGISLLELVTDYPVRLRETVYESNLANHFDLACNSVGASWYVAKDGVTRFRLPGAALPVSAVFSDLPDDGALHYVDVSASYDTRGMVNRLDVTNYGVTADGENEQNENLIVVAQPSIDAYGVRSSRLEVNLWGEPPYDASLADRLAELLADADEPRLFISSLRWNAQENPAAANALEVGQRITVRFKGIEQDSQIVSLQHVITPRRWMLDIGVRGI